MNQRERLFFSDDELQQTDVTSLPVALLLKAIFGKARRKTWGRFTDRDARFVWTVSAVNDIIGPAENVRNYLERRTVRAILADIHCTHPIKAACEVGCGYGRLTMVFNEFADRTVGFEREQVLVDIAQALVPDVAFRRVESLARLGAVDPGPFDIAMTCTVLQHLTDAFCISVLEEIRRITPRGHVLLIEKTDDLLTTARHDDPDAFLSRARGVETYAKWMEPFELVSTSPRLVEPTYKNPRAGTCMLFRSRS